MYASSKEFHFNKPGFPGSSGPEVKALILDLAESMTTDKARHEQGAKVLQGALKGEVARRQALTLTLTLTLTARPTKNSIGKRPPSRHRC